MGRIQFAKYIAAYVICKIAVTYLTLSGVISFSLAGNIDIAMVIALVLVPAAARFHDFGWSGLWPVLVVVSGSVGAGIVTVMSRSATPPPDAQSSYAAVDAYPWAGIALAWVPFIAVVLICLSVRGTDGPNRFGEPASFLKAKSKRSD